MVALLRYIIPINFVHQKFVRKLQGRWIKTITPPQNYCVDIFQLKFDLHISGVLKNAQPI
jgi:hypothetical protein